MGDQNPFPDVQTQIFGGWGRALQGSGGVRVSFLRPPVGDAFSVDQFHLGLRSTVVKGIYVDTGYRYQNAPVFDSAFVLDEIFATSHRGDAGVVVEALPFVSLGVGSGGSFVASDALWHGYGSARLGLKPPGAQRSWLGLHYQEDFGGFSGRTLGLFGNVDVFPWMRWNHRVTYFGTQVDDVGVNSMGYGTRLEVPVQSWWGLAAGLNARLALDPLGDDEAPLTGGLSGSAELFGRY
jgi:hypothetical protein